MPEISWVHALDALGVAARGWSIETGPGPPASPIGTGEAGESVQFAAGNLVGMVMGPNYHQRGARL
jgi:hypothetical protein